MTPSSRSIEVPGLGHNAPIPVAARVGNLICSSGIAGKDPASGELPADGAAQARLAFANMHLVHDAARASLADVARLTITIKDNAVRAAINTEWLACFPDPHDRPARHIAVHDLQHGMLLQLEFIAQIQKEDRP